MRSSSDVRLCLDSFEHLRYATRGNLSEERSQHRAKQRNHRRQIAHDERGLNTQHAVPKPAKLRIPPRIRPRPSTPPRSK